jgi:hypothetical protein
MLENKSQRWVGALVTLDFYLLFPKKNNFNILNCLVNQKNSQANKFPKKNEASQSN